MTYTIPTYMAITPTPTPAPWVWLKNQLIGYWKLDLLNPAYGVFDEVAGENNGVIYNVTEVDGKVGKAGYFKGTRDSYIDITQKQELSQITNNFTLDLWTYRYDTGSRAIASTTNSTDGGFGMFVGNKGEIYCRTSAGDGTYVDSYSSYYGDKRILANNGWHHVAIVKGENYCNIYIDGQIATSVSGYHKKMISSGNPLTLGGIPNHFDMMYSGLIDDVRLYNYARTQEEIQEDMNMKSPGFNKWTPIPTPGKKSINIMEPSNMIID